MKYDKIITYIFASFIFLFCRKETRSVLNDLQNKRTGYVVYHNDFDFGKTLAESMFVVLVLFAVYEITLRLIKSFNIIAIALITGGIPFIAVLIFFQIFYHSSHLLDHVIGAFPILVSGITIPISENLLRLS